MAIAGKQNLEVLLLDEPTNNLDYEALDWLSSFIKDFGGSAVIASHDRKFINEVCTKVLELHEGKVKAYNGNYDAYEEQKDLEDQRKVDEYKEIYQEKRRLEALLKTKTQQMKRASNEHYEKIKHENRMAFHGRKNSAQTNTGKQVKALHSRLNHLEGLKPPDVTKSYDIQLGGASHDKKLLVKLEGIGIVFIQNKLPDFEIRGRDRLRIHGANGTGKSTLLKLAAKVLAPDYGKVTVGNNTSVGYLSQDVDQLDHQKTALDNLRQVSGDMTLIYREARALELSHLDLQKTTKRLSRGQQTKLSFAKLLLSKHDLLILDEPTNHLDIKSRRLIEEALKSYTGALLVSSHDEHFVDAIRINKTIRLSKGL